MKRVRNEFLTVNECLPEGEPSGALLCHSHTLFRGDIGGYHWILHTVDSISKHRQCFLERRYWISTWEGRLSGKQSAIQNHPKQSQDSELFFCIKHN